MIKENKMQLEKEFYELIKKHYNIIKDEKRFKALLCDYFPQQEKWRINALVFLHERGIIEVVEKTPTLEKTERLRLKNELKNEYGMQERNAKWAVEIWFRSYGKWLAEQDKLLNKMQCIVESANWDADDLKIIFSQAAKYPKVLRTLHKVYRPVVEEYGESALEAITSLFIYPLIDKNTVCTYEDNFYLYDQLLKIGCPVDYYAYGMLLIFGSETNDEYAVRQNIEKGVHWSAYFYNEVNKKKIQIITAEQEVKYRLPEFESILGAAYADGSYIKRDEKKAEECWENMLNEASDKWESIDDAGVACYWIGAAYKGKEISVNFNGTVKLEFKISTNTKLAYKYLMKAIEYGNINAYTILAEMYENGDYVNRDMQKAIELYKEAGDKGDKEAKKWLEEHMKNI